jgi:hypothetical protein
LFETQEELFCREGLIDNLGGEIEGASSDRVGRIGWDLDIEILSLADLCEVGVPSEEVVICGVAEGKVEFVESVLPCSLSDVELERFSVVCKGNIVYPEMLEQTTYPK